MVTNNYGILASLDWNSNNWQQPSTEEDLNHSNFGYAKEHQFSFASLNFGYEQYPADEKGFYLAQLPQLETKPLDYYKAKGIEVVFIKSRNWNDSQNYIVGLYAFPSFDKGSHPAPIDDVAFELEYNMKSLPKDICLLENFINLNTHPTLKTFVPKGKDIGKQSFAYLNKQNVLKLLDECSKANPQDARLSNIKFRLLKNLLQKKA